MLTVIYRDERGNESVSEASWVGKMDNLAKGNPEGGEPIHVGDGVAVSRPDGNQDIYPARNATPNEGPFVPTIFVMNRFGATVATYRL